MLIIHACSLVRIAKAKVIRQKAAGVPQLMLPEISSLQEDDVISRRWDEGIPESADYYYNKPLSKKLIKTSPDDDFSPNGMDMLDA